LVETYGKLPLSFEANAGQTDSQVKFLSRGSGYTLFLSGRAETVLLLYRSAQNDTPPDSADTLPATVKARRASTPAAAVRMELVNAQATSQAEGLDELPGKAHYFIGNDPKEWRTNVPLFTKVQYRDIYPGVDLLYYGNQSQLEYDFIVAPGADPRSVALNFTGVEKLSLDAQGGLVLGVNGGEVRMEKPRIYQEVSGARREISGGYVLKNAQQVSFQVAAYDATKSLVIDPTLSYSTYFGVGVQDYAIAVDAGGNAYVTGQAYDVQTTTGAFQTARPTSIGSAFVTKLNPAGSGLVYSTYLGGGYGSAANAIAVDGAGNAYVTGYAASNFPTTPGAFQTTNRSLVGWNAFVTKLNATGSALAYSTYLGGERVDFGQGIAVDAAGNSYVTGLTDSTNFPTTLGAFQPVLRGSGLNGQNAFVTEMNANGTALLYSTYLGGSNTDTGYGIAVDTQDNAYVTGQTCSFDFPVTPLAFQMFYEGGSQQPSCNAFVSKLNPAALGPLSLVYSSYLGGVGDGDEAYGIAVDSQGDAYVTGTTCSVNFPVTPLAFQPVYHLNCDAFVTKFNPTGTGLVYSTFLGGTGDDYGFGIAVDGAGNAYVTGRTSSTDFPTTPGALQPTKPGPWTALVTVLNPAGSALVYSTYLGGSGGHSGDSGRGIAVDNVGNAYVTGWTDSSNFPTTPGAFQTTQTTAGTIIGFVAKFSGF
jgi:hypothetical protein